MNYRGPSHLKREENRTDKFIILNELSIKLGKIIKKYDIRTNFKTDMTISYVSVKDDLGLWYSIPWKIKYIGKSKNIETKGSEITEHFYTRIR